MTTAGTDGAGNGNTTHGTGSIGSKGPELIELASIKDAEVDRWNALAGDAALYSTHRWLLYGEELADAGSRHLVAACDGSYTVGLPTHRFTGKVPHFYDPAVLFPGAAEPATPERPLLLGGTRLGYTSEVIVAPGTAEPLAAAGVRTVLDRLRAMGAEDDGLAALLYLTDESVERLLPHLGPRDQVVMMDATAVLPVDPDGLEGYRRRFTSHQFTSIRREMRRYTDAGCRTEVKLLSECHQLLGPLSAQVLIRYGHPVTDESESERFAQQATLFDDNCRILGAYQGDRMVGFTQYFFWGNTMYARSHGLDDSIAREAKLYFNLTYYEAVKYAAANGYHCVDLSCDAFQAKVSRAARLQPLWGVLLDAPWTGPVLERVRAEERARRREFASHDPGIESRVAQLVDARGR
ncbi:GNAT family N-acetyltransferase [Streptomyces sp. NRRL S-244]|uniref:GNAT family N-acetyltransferase n=1 Tax=Streptomyces sp. NRRL S-244 TaxID=1463897 RepID=UPI0004C1CFB5|nr:GNAT family N-acetyltransferase [Streptomyces sp. NRRL S-244]